MTAGQAQGPSFAETLVRALESAVAAYDRATTAEGRNGALGVMEAARKDLLQALTIPNLPDDFASVRDQIYIALLPAAVANGNQSERTPMVAFMEEAWRNAGLAMAARKVVAS